MKKILSVVLALTMLCAMLIPMTISASAAEANTLLKSYADAQDGDKLIDLLFGQTTGAYQPVIFANGTGVSPHHADSMYKGDPYVTVSDNGAAMQLVYDQGEATGDTYANLQYGAKIDGLKAGKDASGNNYKYTFTFQAKFISEGTPRTGNSGFYFCMDETNTLTVDDKGRNIINMGNGSDNTGAFGWWGHPCQPNSGDTVMRYHTIKADGSTVSNLSGSLSDDFKTAVQAGVADWYDIVIEVDGYNMNISFNGNELGWSDMATQVTNSNGDTADLAFITRLWNATYTLDVKDVSIYKGIGLDLSQEGGDDTTGGEGTTAPSTPSKPGMVYNKLNVALWTNVGGVSDANKLNAEQVAKIKEGFEKVLVDAGYDLSKVTITWTDLCADGGHGVESLVPLTNDGDFDVVLGAGTNAITKGLNAVELKPMVVENTKRQAVLIDDNNAMAKVLYEYITTGNTNGYPAPPQTGDASMFVAISLIAIISLGGAVLVSKKRFN